MTAPAGTSTHLVDDALFDVPYRASESELRAHGTPEECAATYGLDPTGTVRALEGFLG